MSSLIKLAGCKCWRISPYKKCIKNLYPPEATGYETTLEAQNAEDLAKLALRNEKLFVPISKTLDKQIRKDLRKEKYGYVCVGTSAFTTLVDMCHDNLYRFEAVVYDLLQSLLQEKEKCILIHCMHLLIKVCQFKETNDDSSNGKYFDFLNDVSKYCSPDESNLECVLLLESSVNVLYQFVIICPSAMITTVFPQLIPVFVSILRKEDPQFLSIKECASRSLSNIYPLMNIVISSALLNPLFHSLDLYGWYPVTFSRIVLKSLTSAKNKDSYSKPAYLNVVSHIIELLPSFFPMITEKEGIVESEDVLGDKREIEMTPIPLTSSLLVSTINILACSERMIADTRSFPLIHIQHITDILLVLYMSTLKNMERYEAREVEAREKCIEKNPNEYMDDTKLGELLSCLQRNVELCLVQLILKVTGGREYFDVLDSVLYMMDDEEKYSTQILSLASKLISVKYLPSTISIPRSTLDIMNNGIIIEDSDNRLCWIQIMNHLLHVNDKETSFSRMRFIKETTFISSIISSVFISSNTSQHYASLAELYLSILTTDPLQSLLILIPILFYIQSTVVQPLAMNYSLLVQFIEATQKKSALPTELKGDSAISISKKHLDTVESEEEEEESPMSRIEEGEDIDENDEIDMQDIAVDKRESMEDAIVTLDENDLDNHQIRVPDTQKQMILELITRVMKKVAIICKSEELKQRIESIAEYQSENGDNASEMPSYWDGKKCCIQRDVVIQAIMISPLILASALPSDFLEILSMPYTPSMSEEMVITSQSSRLMHRLSTAGSEISLRHPSHDSDSEGQNETGGKPELLEEIYGSTYLASNPHVSFEEMYDRTKVEREGISIKTIQEYDLGVKKSPIPGSNNCLLALIL